jgi:hypothetical protein
MPSGTARLAGALLRRSGAHGQVVGRRVVHGSSGLARAMSAGEPVGQGVVRANGLAAAPTTAVSRYAHSSSARDAVNMGLKGMPPSNRGEYVVTKLDDCASTAVRPSIPAGDSRVLLHRCWVALALTWISVSHPVLLPPSPLCHCTFSD